MDERTSKMYQVSDPTGEIFTNAQRLAELLTAEFGHKVSAPDAINTALREKIERIERQRRKAGATTEAK